METLAEFKRYVSYDPETGLITSVKTGEVLGSPREGGGKTYLRVMVNGKRVRSHRIAWLFITGGFPEGEIDHINGNGCDNRTVNLREVSRAENCKNRRKPKNNTTGAVGVYRCRRTGGWLAQIRVNWQLKQLGTFKEFEKAVAARKQAELLYGFHPNHGQDRPL